MPDTDEKTRNKLKLCKRTVLYALCVILIIATLLVSFGKAFGIPSWNDIFVFCGISADMNAKLSLSFINVGSADACYIKCGDINILIDAGKSLSYDRLYTYLKRNGCTHFNAIIISHTDSDHIGAMADIIKDFGTEALYMYPVDSGTAPQTEEYNRLNNSIKKYKVKVVNPAIPSEIQIGDMSLRFISPAKSYGNINDESLVVRAVFKNISILFTGDISQTVENDLINSNEELKSDILKVAHHGSKYSSSEEFIKAVSPQISVVNASSQSDALPDYSTMALLNSLSKELYCTKSDKTIVVTSDGDTLKVKTHA